MVKAEKRAHFDFFALRISLARKKTKCFIYAKINANIRKATCNLILMREYDAMRLDKWNYMLKSKEFQFNRRFIVGKSNFYHFNKIHGYVDGNIFRFMHDFVYSKGYYKRTECLCLITKDGERMEDGVYATFWKKEVEEKEEIAIFGSFRCVKHPEKERELEYDKFAKCVVSFWTRVIDKDGYETIF